MVYILSKDGKALMPTKRHGKVRRMLKSGMARVVRRTPFTIQLMYETTNITQPVTLGVDAGSKTVGLSATTPRKELYAAEIALRTSVTDLIATRRQYRRGRRFRKTRYREARFDNRRSKKGRLAPTIEQRIGTHIQAVKQVCKFLPVSGIVVETAAFDIQKIKNPDIQGIEYQQGPRLGFFNVREYVLWRDGHRCRHCGGKSKDRVLNVHHIESRKTGGDGSENLVTLCKTCHDGGHAGNVSLRFKRGQSFRHEAFMGIMRWAFYKRLKEFHQNVSMTYGYITKHVRISSGLAKGHCVDARCISGNPLAAPLPHCYRIKAVRRHNRKLHEANFSKGGFRKLSQGPKLLRGFQIFDKVRFADQECFVWGRRASGYFDLRLLDGTKIHASASFKRLAVLEKAQTLLVTREARIPPPPVEVGVSCGGGR